MKSKNLGFNSKLIHGGGYEDPLGSATVPIYQTSTFAFKNADHGAACFSGEEAGYIYTRIGNPTIGALENLVAELENGYGGIAVGSGMAAVNTIYFGLLNQGDHMVSSAAVYGPSRVVMEQHYSRFGVESTYVNTADTEAILKALKPNTRMIYIETPANPTMDITDLKACAKIARENNLYLVVDNTFCSPYLQKPLDLGADIVFHSMTKFLNGHADIVAGIVIAKEEGLYKKLRSTMTNLGCNMDPHQAYEIAQQNFIKGGNNRIILGTDGDFNVGISSTDELVELIEKKCESGIYLTVLGVGGGNLNDHMMEQIANKGNGNYEYIDNVSEIQKVFTNEKSKFYTVAKDAKVQITFNPDKVDSYRLIGYENRKLENEEFEDDEKDGGEIGAGQTITALYEVVLTKDAAPGRYAQFDFRYKMPESDTSRPLGIEVNKAPVEFNKATESTRFAVAVAGFGLLMRESEFKGSLSLQMIQGMAESAITFDPHGYRKEFVKIVDRVK